MGSLLSIGMLVGAPLVGACEIFVPFEWDNVDADIQKVRPMSKAFIGTLPSAAQS